MEPLLTVEHSHQRVLSWLSQSLATPLESNARNFEWPGDSAMGGAEENDNVLRELPRRKELKNLGFPSSSSPGVKGGKQKFYSNDSEHSTVSGSESLEYSWSNRLYCDEERRVIVRYIVGNKLFPFLKGNNIWKQMEKERICARTWQSMKNQFHRYIYPNLKDFDLLKSDRRCIVRSMECSPVKKSPGRLSPGQRGWRKNGNFYSFQEDAAIVYYVLQKNRYEYTNGNTMWKKMECKKILPGRSWHSVKSRYNCYLSHYVEKYAPKQRGRSLRNKLGSLEKVKLMHDFLFDHLIDMSATLGIFSQSVENVKKLNNMGVDCTFSVPLPRYNPHGCERENIKDCVHQISKQLSQKFSIVYKKASGSLKEFKNVMHILDTKYGPITRHLKHLERHNRSESENNFDLSESVQQGLRISTPQKAVRKLFPTSSEKNRNKFKVQKNSQKCTCNSAIKLGNKKKLDTCNKTQVNYSRSTSFFTVELMNNNEPKILVNQEKSTCDSSSQATAVDNVCERNIDLSEKMQTDAMGVLTNGDDRPSSQKDALEKTYFEQLFGMSIKEYFECNKITTESMKTIHSRLEAVLNNLSRLIYSEWKLIHQEMAKKVCACVHINKSNVTEDTCASAMNIKNLASEENLQSLEMLVNLPIKLPNVSGCIVDCTCNGMEKKSNETKETDEISHQGVAGTSIKFNKSPSTAHMLDVKNHTSQENMPCLLMHVDEPMSHSNVSASIPDCIVNGMGAKNNKIKEMYPVNQDSSDSHVGFNTQIHVDANEQLSASMKLDEYVDHNSKNMNYINNYTQTTVAEMQTLEDPINTTTNEDNMNKNSNGMTTMPWNCDAEKVQNSEVLFDCGNSNELQSQTPYGCATESGNNFRDGNDEANHPSKLSIFSESSNSDITKKIEITYVTNPYLSQYELNELEEEDEQEEPLVLRLESDDSDGEY